MTTSVTTHVDVRYAETDQQGIVYHANYLIWMEIGRTTFLREVGFPYDQIEHHGLMFSVSRLKCRYFGAARYGDRVQIKTDCTRLRSRSVTFSYELNVEGEKIVEGETELVALDASRRPRRIPQVIADALKGGVQAAGD